MRCFETVCPLAESTGLPVESVGELAEGHGTDAYRLLQRMAGETAVLCTHGDVATELLGVLAAGSSAEARYGLRLLKGDVWVVQSTGETLEIVDLVRQGP